MNSRERYEAAMRLEEPDRVPILNWHAWCANLIGVKMPEMATNSETWVKAQLASLEKFEVDCAWGLSDAALEAQAMGAEIKMPEWHVPSSEPILRKPEDLDKLQVPDPKKDGRLPVALKVIEMLSEKVGDKVYVIGNACSPFTMIGIIMGIDFLMLSLAKNPDLVRRAMEFSLQHANEWVKAQMDAGADQIITWDPIGSGDLISVKYYREFVVPYAKRMSELVKKHGGKYAHHYHICGYTEDRLPEISEIGESIVSLDEKVDLSIAKERIGGKTCIAGNVKTGVLMSGTPDQVELETRECIRKAASGGGYVLWPGCDIPLDSPIGNVERMVKVGKESKYPLSKIS